MQMIMENNDRHIVAIDLGSSKISVTVAKVNGEDIQVIYYKETPSTGVRYSSIFNDLHARKALEKAVHDAEMELDIKITQAVVGMPKFPIRQESGNATFPDRGEDAEITEEDIADMKRFAQSLYPIEDDSKEAIYGSVAQSFSDGENFQIIEEDIIGMSSNTLEGNFKIFIGKKGNLNKIDSVMNKAGVVPMRKYFTAESTARAVLRESEMESGVALIDFGGGCTSVSIYQGKIMRHFASIPFGGKNITNDIKSECQISERLAENIKLEFGACMPEKLLSLSDKILDIRSSGSDSNKQLSVKYLSEIITARVEEIMMAILYEIEQSGFADSLRSGIVVTGGAAQTANLANLIYDISGFKVRIGYPQKTFSCEGCDGLAETSAATAIGLIMSSINDPSINCARMNESVAETEVEEIGVVGNDQQPQGSLFKEDEIEKVTPEPAPRQARKEKKMPGFITRCFGSMTTKFDNIFDALDEEKVQTVINDDEDEETEEKA